MVEEEADLVFSSNKQRETNAGEGGEEGGDGPNGGRYGEVSRVEGDGGVVNTKDAVERRAVVNLIISVMMESVEWRKRRRSGHREYGGCSDYLLRF
ncbi:hypothetical protein Fmac_029762 [Flemingia macrophylla]|uniref:Uncharacterized protein n=1 Tax=Flemingia macrophylla TaxID=520843 RepID=A0ABD1LBV4_9FABA